MGFYRVCNRIIPSRQSIRLVSAGVPPPVLSYFFEVYYIFRPPYSPSAVNFTSLGLSRYRCHPVFYWSYSWSRKGATLLLSNVTLVIRIVHGPLTASSEDVGTTQSVVFLFCKNFCRRWRYASSEWIIQGGFLSYYYSRSINSKWLALWDPDLSPTFVWLNKEQDLETRVSRFICWRLQAYFLFISFKMKLGVRFIVSYALHLNIYMTIGGFSLVVIVIKVLLATFTYISVTV